MCPCPEPYPEAVVMKRGDRNLIMLASPRLLE
jgi:hypothetical protein